jgi:hypothetical protein
MIALSMSRFHNPAGTPMLTDKQLRKAIEANALVVVPEVGRGRRLCRDSILQFVPEDAPARYERKGSSNYRFRSLTTTAPQLIFVGVAAMVTPIEACPGAHHRAGFLMTAPTGLSAT